MKPITFATDENILRAENAALKKRVERLEKVIRYVLDGETESLLRAAIDAGKEKP